MLYFVFIMFISICISCVVCIRVLLLLLLIINLIIYFYIYYISKPNCLNPSLPKQKSKPLTQNPNHLSPKPLKLVNTKP